MSIVWDRLSELEMCLDGRVELHIDEKEVLDAASGGTAEWEMEREELWMPAHSSSLPSYEHTHTHSYALRSCSASQHARFMWIDTQYVWGYVHVQCDYIQCVWLCGNLCNDCTVVNKQRQALALMKGCCHLFCRNVTIRAPCGSSERLFFCITWNKMVQCINLTLLGETKEGPLIQYNNGARMETWGISATATCYNITTAQHCCQHRKFRCLK